MAGVAASYLDTALLLVCLATLRQRSHRPDLGGERHSPLPTLSSLALPLCLCLSSST